MEKIITGPNDTNVHKTGISKPSPVIDFDEDDPLAGLLSDEEDIDKINKNDSFPYINNEMVSVETTTKNPMGESFINNVESDIKERESTSKNEVKFSDDEDPIGQMEKSGQIRNDMDDDKPARSVMHDLLGKSSVNKLLERTTPSKREFHLDEKYILPTHKSDPKLTVKDTDLSFGTYTPSAAARTSITNGRRAVRFEDKTTEKQPGTESVPNKTKSKINLDWLLDPDMDKKAETSNPDLLNSGQDILKDSSISESPKITNIFTTSEHENNHSASKDIAKEDRTKNVNTIFSDLKSQTTGLEKKISERRQSFSSILEEPHINTGELDNKTVMKTVQEPVKNKEPLNWLGLSDDVEDDDNYDWLIGSEKHLPRPSKTNEKPKMEEPLKEAKKDPDIVLQQAQNVYKAPAAYSLEELSSVGHHTGSNERGDIPATNNVINIKESLSQPKMKTYSLLENEKKPVVNFQKKSLTENRMQMETELSDLRLAYEMCRRRCQEDIAAIEDSFKNRLSFIEENYKQKEEMWKKERDELVNNHRSQIQLLHEERVNNVKQNTKSLAELEKSHLADIAQIHNQHRQSLDKLHQDHSSSLKCIKDIKDMEVASLVNTNSTTRSIHAVIEKMNTSAKDISDLQYKLQDWQTQGWDEREIHLNTRDEQLKVLQDQLHRQSHDIKEEKCKMEQIINDLKHQISEQNRLLEQEQWKLKQEQSKQESLQETLKTERSQWQEKLARDRDAVEKSQRDLLNEQRITMKQIYEERRLITEERQEIDLLKKYLKEKEKEQELKYIKNEAEMEATRNTLNQDKTLLADKRREIENNFSVLQCEWERLNVAKRELSQDRDRLADLSADIALKSRQLDDVMKSANQKQIENDAALATVKQMQADEGHKNKMMDIRLSHLQEREKTVADQQAQLAHEREDIQSLKNSFICTNCKTPVKDTGFGQKITENSNIYNLDRAMNRASALVNADLSVRQMRQRAHHDKIYLDNENAFLESLQYSPYHNLAQATL